jgi:hypothetical protein
MVLISKARAPYSDLPSRPFIPHPFWFLEIRLESRAFFTFASDATERVYYGGLENAIRKRKKSEYLERSVGACDRRTIARISYRMNLDLCLSSEGIVATCASQNEDSGGIGEQLQP